jgi:hypothetical protein
MPILDQFQKVLDGIRNELGSDYNIDVIDIDKVENVEEIANRCKSIDANALILMDIKAVNTIVDLQKRDSTFISIPKFVMMTLMADITTKELSNVSGITFEVPAYTLVTNFRIISQKDFSRVGIFYRKSFTKSIEEASRLLEKEQISLNAICVDCDQKNEATPSDAIKIMNKKYAIMRKAKSIDVFLLYADNLIVNENSIVSFWIDKVKSGKFPVVAPLDILASPEIGLAMFTADPDLTQLGSQAANLILDYFENHIPIDQIGFEKTISIKTTLNLQIANELGWKLKEEKLSRINKIIK